MLPNGEHFKPRHFVNSNTCECGSYYVGKPCQESSKIISKHIQSRKIGNLYLPMGRHVAKMHNCKLPRVSFVALDRIPTPQGQGLE